MREIFQTAIKYSVPRIQIGLSLVAGGFAGEACSSGEKSARPPVAVVNVAHDLLSARFSNAISDVLYKSMAFTRVQGGAPGALLIVIVGNVSSDHSTVRETISYHVEFRENAGTVLGELKGTCWRDDQAKCIEAILTETARIAAKR